jgi:hypothetical protein
MYNAFHDLQDSTEEEKPSRRSNGNNTIVFRPGNKLRLHNSLERHIHPKEAFSPHDHLRLPSHPIQPIATPHHLIFPVCSFLRNGEHVS